jgi:hypothetical protein
MIIKLFNASVRCLLMISFSSLFGVTLSDGMLNGVRYRARRVTLNILAMQSTTKDDEEATTIDVAMIKE